MKPNKPSNSTSPPSAERQWDVDRYLLDDPTLDRSEFEQRMLDDLSLAEQVAASVEQLQWLEAAARICEPTSAPVALASKQAVQSIAKRSNSSVWTMLAAVAVTCLVAFGVWRQAATDGNTDQANLDFAANDRQLSQIAEHWFAIGTVQNTVHDDDELLEAESGQRKFESGEQTEVAEAVSVDTESAEATDWLVEAARQFYQDREGTQG